MIRFGLILMTICLCAALVLSATNKLTQAKIEAQVASEETGALKEIFPEADDFKKDPCDCKRYYQVELKDELIGYVVKVKAKGYASDIDMLVGVDLKGKIKAIKVISQNETPGLGAKIVEVKPGEDKPWFLRQFEGKKARDLSLENIDAITAATITSEAVINGVKKQVSEFLSKIK
ncbi:MAG: RnfABCDGE type electron transport complex subunit G [Candidatus Omnitrophota bacterium]